MRNRYSSKKKSAGICCIRNDIKNKGYTLPLTRGRRTEYVDGKTKLPYRWLKDTTGFQIYYEGLWWDAISIDWDFLPTCERKVRV